jgi:DNA-binding LacI/PurR family transcriptional regulator
MSVTIKQIAERTGLSISTVGNVVGRASSRYSEVTRKKVFAAVQEMGYRPNSSARAIRQGRTGCAAMILSRSHLQVLSHMPAGLLDGLDEELARHNMHLSVSRLSDEELSSEDFVPKVLREYVADGMIVNYTHEIPPRMLELIHAHHTPAVWLNSRLPSDCVRPDDAGGAEMATRMLIARGHRRIAIVHLVSPVQFAGLTFAQARPRLHYSVADRIEGYSRAMRAAGLEPRITYNDRFVSDEEVVKACMSLLGSPDRPTAVLAYSENETPSILIAAAHLRLSLPRELTVLQFAPADQWIAGMQLPAVPIPTEEMGRTAVRMLLRKIEAPNELCDSEAVAYSPLKNDAIAPPAS